MTDMDKMPCSITDGPQYDDGYDEIEIDEDARFEQQREDAIENRERFARTVTDDLLNDLPDIMLFRNQAE